MPAREGGRSGMKGCGEDNGILRDVFLAHKDGGRGVGAMLNNIRALHLSTLPAPIYSPHFRAQSAVDHRPQPTPHIFHYRPIYQDAIPRAIPSMVAPSRPVPANDLPRPHSFITPPPCPSTTECPRTDQGFVLVQRGRSWRSG